MTLECGQLRERALRTLGELPPFSPILNKLMASLADDTVAIASLADLIEKDPVLAGNILSIVNSAAYGRRHTVNSVRHAISLLGTSKVRNVALGMSVAGIWNRLRFPPDWSMRAFDLHSASTAVLADLLALEMPVEYPEGAFAAGLLHDLGRVLMVAGMPKEFSEAAARHKQTGQPMFECERTLFGFTHADLSGAALESWSLPEPIIKAAATHHDAEPSPLGRVIALADAYVHSLNPELLDPLPPKRREKLLASFETEHSVLSSTFR